MVKTSIFWLVTAVAVVVVCGVMPLIGFLFFVERLLNVSRTFRVGNDRRVGTGNPVCEPGCGIGSFNA